MAKSNAIIIKRIKKAEHAHHGGAWKVAYADFVTAMMAFFLLLWLLNATTDAQKRGIADYFAPTLATKSTVSGAAGVMGGRTISPDGAEINNAAPPAVANETPQAPDTESDGSGQTGETGIGPGTNTGSGADSSPGGLGSEVNTATLGKLTDAQFAALKATREEKQLQQAEHDLRQAIQNVPDLQPLARNLLIDRTEEGLRIQMVDQEKTAMFALGSTQMSEQADKLMGLVAQAALKLSNRISITGHTDATPYLNRQGYSNWELSADRANAARRALVEDGLPETRISTVVGKADTENLIVGDPNDPRNRRISIVLLRENKLPPPAPAQAQPASIQGSTAAPIQSWTP